MVVCLSQGRSNANFVRGFSKLSEYERCLGSEANNFS